MKFKSLKYIVGIAVFVALATVLAACQPAAEPTAAPTQAIPTPVPCPTQEPCAAEVPEYVPFFEMWKESAHADAEAQAFVHWNEESPAEIPTTCAKCHSSIGFKDYIGDDGTEAYKVDANAPIGTVVTCDTCHNATTASYTTVKFPSGAEVSGLGREAVCMTCHQGNASKVQVDEAIAAAGATDEDGVVTELGFTNIHYFAAAVSRYGTEVKGGYEYEGKTYDALFDHVEGVQACQDCHNPHTLEVELDTCVGCHTNATSVEALRDIRMASSLVDYDGDGDTSEGISYEIDGLREMLYTAIQAYATEVAGSPIAYSQTAYPYFFIDTDGDGQLAEAEAAFPNKYASWTPRLEKAAYNYQTSIKDPGAFAHGGKYIIQLLYDSIESLNEKLATPVDLSKANRIDAGHFAGSEEAFRHWDEEDPAVVPGTCVKCHTGMGLPQFLKEGATISMAPSNGLMCETCHSSVSTFERYQVELVTFPSGAKLGFEGNADANLCLNCHQGRESTVSVNRTIAGKDLDTPDEKLSFRNVHYFAAGATLFGTDAKGVYEYEGKEYKGQFAHVENFATCVDCHDTHALNVKEAACAGCHAGVAPEEIRMSSVGDYDGDGDTTEGVKGEVDTMAEKLLAAIQVYAKDVLGTPIAYSPSAYPYFFIDTNGNGTLDADETERYNAWSPRLLKAAYNYQYVQKDPGAFVHNGQYILQVMYDSIEDLGAKATVDKTGLVRP